MYMCTYLHVTGGLFVRVCVCVYYFMCIQVYIEETERGRRKEEIEKRGGRERECFVFLCFVFCAYRVCFTLWW